MSQTRTVVAGVADSATDTRSLQDPGDATLTADFRVVRERSLALTTVLEIEDYGLQPMPDASPAKWHLAHTTWFFETFLLKPYLASWRPVDARYEYLFNSYYNAVGSQFPRARRGQLSRPTVREVLDYRQRVDEAMATLLAAAPMADEVRVRTLLGMHHEEQHQELLLTDLKYAFGHNPLAPSYGGARAPVPGAPTVLTWSRFDGALVEIGVDPVLAPGDRHDFAFDNETPSHRVWLQPFELADRCVTCGEFLAFMADGGYDNPALWLADGWAWLQAGDGPRAPLYWRPMAGRPQAGRPLAGRPQAGRPLAGRPQAGRPLAAGPSQTDVQEAGGYVEYRLSGEAPVDPHVPVTHLSFYEADAFARWAGARLPSEAEWETAARSVRALPAGGNFVESGSLHPVADRIEGTGPRQMLGNQWEWTTSAYAPYPGFEAPAGALGEYNGKFMCNQVVLRGGSCVTPRDHIRTSYRNFFYPPDRWQFTGVRLARDL